LLLFVGAGIAYSFLWDGGGDAAWYWGVIGFFIPIALAALVWLVARLTGGGPLGRWWNTKQQERRRERERRRQEALRQLKHELEQLACDNRVRSADIGTVPFLERPIYLHYQHVKAKLCRPLAASR
jgi:hypothetical protein